MRNEVRVRRAHILYSLQLASSKGKKFSEGGKTVKIFVVMDKFYPSDEQSATLSLPRYMYKLTATAGRYGIFKIKDVDVDSCFRAYSVSATQAPFWFKMIQYMHDINGTFMFSLNQAWEHFFFTKGETTQPALLTLILRKRYFEQAGHAFAIQGGKESLATTLVGCSLVAFELFPQ